MYSFVRSFWQAFSVFETFFSGVSFLAPAPNSKIIENLYRRELKGYEVPIHFANDGDKFIVK